jgi:hypothetical protein
LRVSNKEKQHWPYLQYLLNHGVPSSPALGTMARDPPFAFFPLGMSAGKPTHDQFCNQLHNSIMPEFLHAMVRGRSARKGVEAFLMKY